MAYDYRKNAKNLSSIAHISFFFRTFAPLLCRLGFCIGCRKNNNVMAIDEGEMLEWLKRHAWKACKLQKGFRGSNPRLSARIN